MAAHWAIKMLTSTTIKRSGMITEILHLRTSDGRTRWKRCQTITRTVQVYILKILCIRNGDWTSGTRVWNANFRLIANKNTANGAVRIVYRLVRVFRVGKEESCNNCNEGDLCAMRNKDSLCDPTEQLRRNKTNRDVFVQKDGNGYHDTKIY